MSATTAQGNIFLTTENLAFSLPLLLVCGTYAFFNFVPLQYGIPALGGLALLIKMNSQVQAQREEKLTNLDDKAIDDLALELEGEEQKSDKDSKKKQTAKKRAQVEQRLAAERKKFAQQGKKKGTTEDDDGDDYLETFAKGGTKKKK